MTAKQTTEHKTEIIKILEEVLQEEIAAKPEIKDLLTTIELTPYTVGKKMPKIFVVSVEKDLLRFVRMHYKEYLVAMKKVIPDCLILTMRNTAIPEKKGLTVNRKREEILQDLCFPAMIYGRSQEVEDRENVTQMVYLDAKQSFWNETSMEALQKLATEILKDKFEFTLFAN